MAFRRSEGPDRHVFDLLSKPVFHHVSLELREFDAGMRFESMPKIAAAVAHEFHLGLVFPFNGMNLHHKVLSRFLNPLFATISSKIFQNAIRNASTNFLFKPKEVC